MEWNTMSRKQAHDFIDRMNVDDSFYQDNIERMRHPDLDGVYKEIHDLMRSRFDEWQSGELNRGMPSNKRWYSIDLDMAEILYRTLDSHGFTLRDASDREVWIYMSVEVIPDIIYDRFRRNLVGRMPHIDRYYNNIRRVYPSMLWWYFRISLQSGADDPISRTKEILSLNQADDISQLLERSGDGYPMAVYNAIMVEYHERLVRGCRNEKLLRKVLKLNLVRMDFMEPELTSGGLERYVKSLFDEVG